MNEAGNGASFGTEMFHIVVIQARMQDFNGGSGIEIDVLTKVNFGEAPLP
jgi:hypothetical protein